jgi:hypothetical protein
MTYTQAFGLAFSLSIGNFIACAINGNLDSAIERSFFQLFALLLAAFWFGK